MGRLSGFRYRDVAKRLKKFGFVIGLINHWQAEINAFNVSLQRALKRLG